MRMNTLINKFKVIRYFIKNGIFNEERAIEISKFDHNTIEALVHSQLFSTFSIISTSRWSCIFG